MRTSTFILAVLVLAMTACSGCDDRGGDKGFRIESNNDFTFSTSPGNIYYVAEGSLRIYGDGGYDGVVQEFSIAGEVVMIEFLSIKSKGWTWARDIHRVDFGDHLHIKTYPANVEDCPLDANGFGILFRKAGLNINVGHAQPIAGHVAKSAKEKAIRWEVVAGPDDLRVKLPQGERVYAVTR